MAESLKNRPHEHCTTITLDDPEVFISFYDPANGFCHTFSCSEFATAFGDGLAAHKQSIGHLGACCVDEHLQKMHIANEITYEELERKQAIHRSLTCPLCPEGGIKLLPPQYYAHVCSKSHMEREKAVDGYESTGLLSWYTCREPYCPHFDEKIPPWKLSDHLRSDAHAHAHHLLQALADIGMSADQLASRAVFVRMRMCDARGCPCYGFERRFPSAELLLHHMELDTHRAVQRNQLGLPVMSQYAPEEAHFCRLIGCKGHSTFGTHDFRTSSSYARHIDGRRHQEAVGRMKERVISTVCNPIQSLWGSSLTRHENGSCVSWYPPIFQHRTPAGPYAILSPQR